MNFSDRLLVWYDANKRALPWRDSDNPYKVWISEVILQQTRVEQGIAYYFRFLDAFPDVISLASASEDEVLRLWQGLGYYSRARNLHQTAREILEKHGKNFPESSEEWMRLKGVGPYTAAAVTSIVFKEAIPALDGNVYRVLARAFALPYNMDTSKGKKQFYQLATQLIDPKRPGDFNQAMMDLGAMICKPSGPLCLKCPLNTLCLAKQQNAAKNYPVRNPKKAVRERFFNYFKITTKDPQGKIFLFIKKRQENDIWKNMYDFPLLETTEDTPPETLFKHPWWLHLFPDEKSFLMEGQVRQRVHKLTHQTIHAKLFQIFVHPENTVLLNKIFIAVDFDQFEQMAKPRLIELLHWDRGEKS